MCQIIWLSQQQNRNGLTLLSFNLQDIIRAKTQLTLATCLLQQCSGIALISLYTGLYKEILWLQLTDYSTIMSSLPVIRKWTKIIIWDTTCLELSNRVKESENGNI